MRKSRYIFQHRHLILFAVICLLTGTSCSRYYYKPNAVNTPLFTNGGQAHLAFAGSTGSGDGTGNTNFFDIQASVSPIRHLGILANYSTYNYNPDVADYNSGQVRASAYLAEGGVGGYYAVGQRKVQMVLDLYGGAGVGHINSDVDMDVTRLFLQPGIGMHSPWVDASFNMRLSRVMYANLDDNNRGDTYLKDRNLIDQYNKRIDEGGYTFFEPAITVRAGYKFAKVQFQTVFANELNYVPWNYNGARFTVGFYLGIEDIIEAVRDGNKRASDD